MSEIYPTERLRMIEDRLVRIEAALMTLNAERTRGAVYVISDNQGRYKIGKATDAAERVKGIRTGNTTATLVLAIETDDRHQLERALHRIYRNADRHLSGEWYALGQADINALSLLPSPLFADEMSQLESIKAAARQKVEGPKVATQEAHPAPIDVRLLVGQTEEARILTALANGQRPGEVAISLCGQKGGAAYTRASAKIAAVITHLALQKGAH